MNSNILIIDDDIYIGNMLEELLTREGYGVMRAYSGTEALLLLEAVLRPDGGEAAPDLILLDLMLPGLSGDKILPKMQGIPVIVLSARAGLDDKVQLLLGGAADYMTKPFEGRELLARIAVQLRKTDAGMRMQESETLGSADTESRMQEIGMLGSADAETQMRGNGTFGSVDAETQMCVNGAFGSADAETQMRVNGVFGSADAESRMQESGRLGSADAETPMQGNGISGHADTEMTLEFKDLVMRLSEHSVTVGGQPVRLTKTEYAILKILMQNPAQVITKSALLDRISEDTPDCVESSLKVHISNLRKKLREAGSNDGKGRDNDQEYIEAVWGIGFKLKTE